jgi:hypothetical protein
MIMKERRGFKIAIFLLFLIIQSHIFARRKSANAGDMLMLREACFVSIRRYIFKLRGFFKGEGFKILYDNSMYLMYLNIIVLDTDVHQFLRDFLQKLKSI